MLKTSSKVKFGACVAPEVKEKFEIKREFEVVLFKNQEDDKR